MQQSNPTNQPPRRRPRRKKTKVQIFKEKFLPLVIVLFTLVMCFIFVIGSFQRARQRKALQTEAENQASSVAMNLAMLQLEEASDLMDMAAVQASHHDYAGAAATLESFSGDMGAIAGMKELHEQYAEKDKDLVIWPDMDSIPNLSFQMLIADPSRALGYGEYGAAFNKGYVLTTEFSKILQKLYDRGYVLVSVHDLATEATSGYVPGEIRLPQGKKPLVLTQTAVNYFTYMVDGDGDGLPDQDGGGFASRLVVAPDGRITAEMVDASGATVTGDYDLVPILDAFIEEHPDFSYHGAKATLAVMGYDGVFGYRTDPDTAQKMDQQYYQEQLDGARTIVEALKADGYDLACYSYDSAPYSTMSASEIRADLTAWKDEVAPIVGDLDVLVYYNGFDIGDNGDYDGEKFEILRDAGFGYFIGMDHSSTGWVEVKSNYVRQTRRLVTGSRLAYDTEVFSDLFDTTGILSTVRGTVPQ